MSDLATQRAAIVAKLETVTDIGAVQAYQRYAKRLEDLRKLYMDGDRLLGWYVSRMRTTESSDYPGRWQRNHRWRIRGFMALSDEDKTEHLFDEVIEAVAAAFRADDTLGGAVDSMIVGNEAGIQVVDSGPVMFAGVLCHSAQLALNTRVYL